MGYYAKSWETDFTIPADKVDAALAALNADPERRNTCWHQSHFTGGSEPVEHDCQQQKPFTSLPEAVDHNTDFTDSDIDNNGDFVLGYFTDSKWRGRIEDVFAVLAPFAVDGSFIRLIGDDNGFFGYQFSGGRMFDEIADVQWRVAPWAQNQGGGAA